MNRSGSGVAGRNPANWRKGAWPATLVVVASGSLLLARGASAQGLEQCGNFLVNPCTSSSITSSVIATTTSDYCAKPGDTFDLDVTISMEVPAGTRYDPALWIAVEGGADPRDPGNQCWTEILSPDGMNHEEPADGCNDISETDGLVVTTRTFTVSCGWDDMALSFLFTWSEQGEALDCPSELVYSGSDCYLDTSAVVNVPRCGDGNIDGKFGETCDDGNDVDDDACPNSCGLTIDFQDGFEAPD